MPLKRKSRTKSRTTKPKSRAKTRATSRATSRATGRRPSRRSRVGGRRRQLRFGHVRHFLNQNPENPESPFVKEFNGMVNALYAYKTNTNLNDIQFDALSFEVLRNLVSNHLNKDPGDADARRVNENLSMAFFPIKDRHQNKVEYIRPQQSIRGLYERAPNIQQEQLKQQNDKFMQDHAKRDKINMPERFEAAGLQQRRPIIEDDNQEWDDDDDDDDGADVDDLRRGRRRKRVRQTKRKLKSSKPRRRKSKSKTRKSKPKTKPKSKPKSKIKKSKIKKSKSKSKTKKRR